MKTKKYPFQLLLSLACLLLACGCASEPTHPRDPDPLQVTCASTDSFGSYLMIGNRCMVEGRSTISTICKTSFRLKRYA